jgi:hypothetical protein
VEKLEVTELKLLITESLVSIHKTAQIIPFKICVEWHIQRAKCTVLGKLSDGQWTPLPSSTGLPPSVPWLPP